MSKEVQDIKKNLPKVTMLTDKFLLKAWSRVCFLLADSGADLEQRCDGCSGPDRWRQSQAQCVLETAVRINRLVYSKDLAKM